MEVRQSTGRTIMKKLLILGILLARAAQGVELPPACIAHGATEIPPYLIFKHRTLVSVTDQMVMACVNSGMEIIRQTTNSLACKLSILTIYYTLVRLGDGVRVSWAAPQTTYNGMPVGDPVDNGLICGVILEAGKPR
jgi:hypothetical protein